MNMYVCKYYVLCMYYILKIKSKHLRHHSQWVECQPICLYNRFSHGSSIGGVQVAQVLYEMRQEVAHPFQTVSKSTKLL